MLAAIVPLLILLIAAPIYVRADPEPNSPGPGDVTIEGQLCRVGWIADSQDATWKTMVISLMTGDNFSMIRLATVAIVDGTDSSKTTFSFTCPQVTPHSPIYFYQFSSPDSTNMSWTGRFTITDSAKNVVPAVNATQPNGAQIPWGIGALVNAASSSASPMSTTSSTSTNATSSASSTTSTSSIPPTSTAVIIFTSGASATPSSVSSAGENGAATLSISGVFPAGLGLLAALGFFAML